MSFFDTHLKDSESLFIDEIALDLDYVPKFIKFRENQQQQIADTIKILLKKRTATNIFLTGSQGIGKTLSVLHILRELEEKGLNEQIYPIYINCWKKNTAHKIVLEICSKLNYRFTVNKTTDQLINDISRIINQKSAVFVLDEIDKIESSAIDIVYHLLEGILRKSVILITNNKNFLSEIDQRIFSRLTPEVIEYKPYTEQETYEILKERIKYAFVPNTFKENSLKLISKKAFDAQDIRIGLFLLREAGNISERKSKKTIENEEAQDAIKKLPEFTKKTQIELTEEENKLLEIIKNNQGYKTTEIHSLFNPNISYKTFYRKLKILENAGLINIKHDNQGETNKSLVYFGSVKKLDEF